MFLSRLDPHLIVHFYIYAMGLKATTPTAFFAAGADGRVNYGGGGLTLELLPKGGGEWKK
jgi:hypothetical protein